MDFSSKTFAKAAQIAEQIESLESQLRALLRGENGDAKPASKTYPRTAPRRRITQPRKPATAVSVAARNRRGTLRPAVVAVLQKSAKPLKTAEVYDALLAQGYKFPFKEPKKILGIRLYKMLGVQSLGDGLSKAKEA